ncbi:MAG: succinate dehydrogenase assembly factor 2 [Methylobacter sp.]|uniref:FAD assembly factor SdhE n=1 Tax=Methylobacter sp. TaxID=2051955 RepID=UPI00272FF7F2|nr:succinate dehydrogenase assembly factor 2 [Methylobacter sp.]MDP1663835.1 succinate dehydrogenase assembly factor 2 [Methylobacter sp.]MDP1969897.1 succinate dehydrogenase assembly factor 2 [Methylobacter sp.]
MDELARLKWQCRRGTKELDFLLNRYLETGYLVADQGERELFVELLGMEDDMLIAILMGNWKLEAKEMESFVNRITK